MDRGTARRERVTGEVDVDGVGDPESADLVIVHYLGTDPFA